MKEYRIILKLATFYNANNWLGKLSRGAALTPVI